MNGPTGHFAAGVLAGVALTTSVIDTVFQRSRPTTIVHCRSVDSLPDIVPQPVGWSVWESLANLVQFVLFVVICGCSVYAWYSADEVPELVPEAVLAVKIEDIGPIVSTPSIRRRKS